MKNQYFVLFLILMIPMASAFADSNDDSCWFIFCWFVSNDKSTTEETSIKVLKETPELKIICGKGTIDIDGICQVDKSEIKVKHAQNGRERAMSSEEIYLKAAQNGRDTGITAIKNEILKLKESSKIMSDAQKSGKLSGANKLIDATNERADFLQKLIDEYNYVRNNPDEFLSHRDLVNRAMNYYKIQPNGTPCDDDRRWVDDRNACIREDRAKKIFGSWDLEWLRDHPELENDKK